ncbi:MAG: 4Fe-4S binding protein, partial [Clostridia bacterium]|nr:4Fe-4S binding protein [Clostridia bacterium]
MGKYLHSVTLDKDRCEGCTNCIKRCPTEAIRVRGQKAIIITDRCIDCGECIRICPHNAKKAIFDPLELSEFSYRIALPAPALFGQFDHIDDIDYILTALKGLGFDDVFEVSRAAEIVTEYTRRFLSEHKADHPYISTACPAVVRLVEVRFPYLTDYLLPVISPVELAARMAKKEARKK